MTYILIDCLLQDKNMSLECFPLPLHRLLEVKRHHWYLMMNKKKHQFNNLSRGVLSFTSCTKFTHIGEEKGRGGLVVGHVTYILEIMSYACHIVIESN